MPEDKYPWQIRVLRWFLRSNQRYADCLKRIAELEAWHRCFPTGEWLAKGEAKVRGDLEELWPDPWDRLPPPPVNRVVIEDCYHVPGMPDVDPPHDDFAEARAELMRGGHSPVEASTLVREYVDSGGHPVLEQKKRYTCPDCGEGYRLVHGCKTIPKGAGLSPPGWP